MKIALVSMTLGMKISFPDDSGSLTDDQREEILDEFVNDHLQNDVSGDWSEFLEHLEHNEDNPAKLRDANEMGYPTLSIVHREANIERFDEE